MNKLKDKHTNSWNTEISALLYLSEIIGCNKHWRITSYFKDIHQKVKKLYFIDPKKAYPILISMLKQYCKNINFNINKAWSLSIIDLIKIICFQLTALTGMRGMEVLKYNNKKSKNGLKYGYINVIYYNSKLNKKRPNYLKITIPPGLYKNARSRTQPKTIILGDTYDDIINPFKLILIYIKRMKKLANDQNKPLTDDDYLFMDETLEIVKTNQFPIWLKEFFKIIKTEKDPNYNYTWHGWRSGLTTYLRHMGIPIEKICTLVGWSTNFLQSASYGYIRVDNHELAALAHKIIVYKPKEAIHFFFE